MLIGGSEGGVASPSSTDLLASHGYPTLALAYFHAPGLPTDLRNIPLEYFASAARWLARQPGVDPAHVVAAGGSRGTEAALLLSQNFPNLVHGAVLYAPSAKINGSFPDNQGGALDAARPAAASRQRADTGRPHQRPGAGDRRHR